MVQLPKREESVSDYLLPDEDVYTVVLDRLSEERPGKYLNERTGEYPPEQEFYFKIINDEEFEGVELRVFVRTDTFYDGTGKSPNPAKVFLIARALLGASFEPGMPPDTDDLVGLKCRGTVTHKKKVNSEGTEMTYANLTGFSPIRERKPRAQENQASEPMGDVDDIPF